MAKNTALTALKGALAIGPKVQTVQRTVDFAANNLSATEWFELFECETGDVVIGGAIEIVTAGTTATSVANVGTESDESLVASVDLTAAAGTITPFSATAGIVIGADTIDLEVETANATDGAVRVTAVILKAGDFAG